MTVQPVYVGTTPTLTDTILDEEGRAVDLTGATVTLVYRPQDSSTPAVSISATPDPDQVTNMGLVTVLLGSPFMDAATTWVCWWHVVFANSALLDTDNFEVFVITHGPSDSPMPYITPSLFRALTRVKQSRLGIAVGQPNADLLLQTELTRSAAYVEFVTGQPAMDSTKPVLATFNGLATDAWVTTLVGQAIQMRTEQITFQAQHSYVDDATDDVVSSFTVGGYSQSKNDAARRGEERQLNSWGALADILWGLMTLDRYYYWIAFLSGDNDLMIGATYSFENTFEPGSIGPWGGFGFGLADNLIALEYGSQIGIGGWQGYLGGLPGGILPLPVD